MKYVIYNDKTFSIFPDSIKHSDMTAEGRVPISGGFIKFSPPDVECFGESVSLGLVSGDSDSKIISKLLKVFE